MSVEIKLQEVDFHKLTVDPCGKLFTWRGRLFRAIHHDSVEIVRDLFQGGLLGELIGLGLFPPSRISDYTLEGFGMVVEHDWVKPLVYPFEWSFSMLKDAALALLEINSISEKYGYQTMDCHGYNVCFDKTSPVFVDLGSFRKIYEENKSWPAYEEFLSFYYYPLNIWSHGNHFFARRALLGCCLNDKLNHVNYYLYRFPFIRPLKGTWPDFMSRLFLKFGHFSLYIKSLPRVFWGNESRGGRVRNLRPADARLFPELRRKIDRLSLKGQESSWGGYHEDYCDGSGIPKPHRRFEKIIEIVSEYGIKDALELAGNQGVFAYHLLKRIDLNRMICTDSDENAVDAMVENIQRWEINVTPAVLDFMFPMTNYANNRSAFERFKSDAVIALAVTHHLVLGQKLSVDLVLQTLRRYSNQYVFVEFMPLGLHCPGRPVDVPEWYHFDWFKESFEKYYRLLRYENLEENRILFVGEIIKG